MFRRYCVHPQPRTGIYAHPPGSLAEMLSSLVVPNPLSSSCPSETNVLIPSRPLGDVALFNRILKTLLAVRTSMHSMRALTQAVEGVKLSDLAKKREQDTEGDGYVYFDGEPCYGLDTLGLGKKKTLPSWFCSLDEAGLQVCSTSCPSPPPSCSIL